MTKEAIQSVCRAIAILAIVVGAYGSVLCLPFALSTDLAIIATAGIYFIAGGVMIVGGLLSYTVSLKTA